MENGANPFKKDDLFENEQILAALAAAHRAG